jgi:hypothetical protein
MTYHFNVVRPFADAAEHTSDRRRIQLQFRVGPLRLSTDRTGGHFWLAGGRCGSEPTLPAPNAGSALQLVYRLPAFRRWLRHQQR